MSNKKQAVWQYQGDMKCPDCGCYSSVWTKGRGGNMIMRLTCKHGRGTYLRDANTPWQDPDKFMAERERAHIAELNIISIQLKGGKAHAMV
ncbi:MAG: hypothetical protein HF312_17140 [Ignavibacteria bacterium]|nr:hypothetical protein [Ignavibacteria bacterium]